eukprot:scaffold34660_cov175-Amphora_coffeaeformis.AAC.2
MNPAKTFEKHSLRECPISSGDPTLYHGRTMRLSTSNTRRSNDFYDMLTEKCCKSNYGDELRNRHQIPRTSEPLEVQSN